MRCEEIGSSTRFWDVDLSDPFLPGNLNIKQRWDDAKGLKGSFRACDDRFESLFCFLSVF
jgi:hypothetical protein